MTLFTKKPFDFKSEEVKILVENLIKDIINSDLDNKILFNFHQNKK